MFSTAADNQPSVDVNVAQGEREMVVDNKSLGRFELTGLPPAPRGVPQIEVTFDIDANGILNVSAKDLGTGKEQAIKITAKSGLSDEEIANMVKEAEVNAEDDKKKKEAVSTKNELDNMIYQTEKLVKENEKDLSEDDISSTTAAVDKAKLALKDSPNDTEVLKEALQELTASSHTLSSALYEKQKTSSASADTPAEPPKPDKGGDVVDADYKDVNPES